MLEKVDIDSLLHTRAKKFEDGAHEGASGRCAWGQFLDVPKRDEQIGPYGTSAGLLTLALAGRGESALVKGAVQQLQDWWLHRRQTNRSRKDEKLYAQERIAQTLRLAIMHLALRVSEVPEAQTICSETDAALRAQMLPSGLWGDYWIDSEHHDKTPRYFSSAIVILALSLFRATTGDLDKQLQNAADLLESRFISVSPPAPGTVRAAESAAVSAALLTTKGGSLSRAGLTRMNRLGVTACHWRGERTIYHFNYEVPREGDRRFRNGYFIVPAETLLGIAGFHPHAPGSPRLAAERIVGDLSRNIEQYGAFKSEKDQLPSSMDQAWAAILLGVVAKSKVVPATRSRVNYALMRERKDNWVTTYAIPLTAMASVTAANALLTDAHLAMRLFVPVSALIIGGLYAPTIVQGLLRRPT